MTCSPEKAKPSPSESAAAIVKQRGKVYGHPAKNFDRIAALWNVVLADRFADEVDELTAVDVAQMFRLAKEARLIETQDHFDSLVDICGYADTQHMVLEGFAEPPTERNGAGGNGTMFLAGMMESEPAHVSAGGPAVFGGFAPPEPMAEMDRSPLPWWKNGADNKKIIAERGFSVTQEVALLPGVCVLLFNNPATWEIKDEVATDCYRLQKVGADMTKLAHVSEIEKVVVP